MFKSGVCFVFIVSLLEFSMSLSNEKKAEILAKFIKVGEKCIIDYPLTKEEIAAFKEGKFPDSRGAACFSACILTTIGLMDDKGEISITAALERAKTIFKDEEELKIVEDFLNTCAKDGGTKGEDKCDRAKEIFICFIKNSKKFDL